MVQVQQDGRPITARPPWRQLYKAYRYILLVARLPCWAAAALISRPKNWTFKQSLMQAFFRDYVDIFSSAGVNAPWSLKPGKEGARFKVIDGAQFPPSFYQGPAAASTEVRPGKMGGTWHPAEPPQGGPATTTTTTTTTGPVLMWIHGGAFVMGDSRDDFSGFAGTTLIQHAGAAAVFCVDYRLSGYYHGRQNPFPAAFQDVITAYLYLTETLRIPAAQITVGGDSAGGNLTLAFLRYVEAYGAAAGLARPGCAALASPWVSPLDTLDPACAFTAQPAWATDYLPVSFLRWGATTYRPARGVDDDDAVAAYITPLGHEFATAVPLFIWYGEAEVLRPGIVAFAEQMRKILGNRVELVCEKDAVHDTLIVGNVLGWAESAQGTAAKLGEFVRKYYRASTV
ncbi:unnamed protein product [Discula destructiva]